MDWNSDMAPFLASLACLIASVSIGKVLGYWRSYGRLPRYWRNWVPLAGVYTSGRERIWWL